MHSLLRPPPAHGRKQTELSGKKRKVPESFGKFRKVSERTGTLPDGPEIRKSLRVKAFRVSRRESGFAKSPTLHSYGDGAATPDKLREHRERF